ncbi:GntR family transcriptional regulator [Ornithinibacillus halophilus]|uniref:DNA-binding transcriptional regulator, GntR family n=1 Tax=Ornithinibacillus halophilus TaxID=930117 RepID=A0A1M5DY45_9BACI|nr:GntR family transcriptional regulator [Ornithinibacillus halophilus]SHF71794.1 DNA-binding transcriptional regulator, GntR family [Ornithinibacillus halophilus]
MPIPTDHSKPVRKTAKENAYNQILHWIIDGTLYPGEKLNDTELANALGVSRTPVRESLQLLESQGFVKMFPGKATQVTEVEKESMNELLPPLAVLQALSTELAINHTTPEIITELKQSNEKFKNAILAQDYRKALIIDEQFHQLIVDLANNKYITTIVEKLQAHVRRLFFHHSIILSMKSVEEHNKIIRFIELGDKEQAPIAMRYNWLRITKEYDF